MDKKLLIQIHDACFFPIHRESGWMQRPKKSSLCLSDLRFIEPQLTRRKAGHGVGEVPCLK